ncbi:MAG: C40 family peptidase [Proteobacteria bacterium]|nr:NlpC/P60 family protein [Desulfobacula sp.]MBU3951367.1 C40 family peptidase [Pseudomonadota bacterium]MBU4130303.1 C40 family peptidase [Pseudomonadota bacterium]
MKHTIPRIILFLFFILLTGCGLQKHQKPTSHIPPEAKDKAQLIETLPQNLSDRRQTIVRHAIYNLGQPYVWGGNSPSSGFDCSGLVFYTHGKAGLRIPRTAREQFRKGDPISRKAIVPGDLIFFTSPEKKSDLHVGIFIGNAQFIHAPGRGRLVSLSSLMNRYFNQHFKGARSYLMDTSE